MSKQTTSTPSEVTGAVSTQSYSQPSPKQLRRWRQYLANERAEAAVYRELAKNKEGEEREILLQIAEAEARHEAHWRELLGDDVGMPVRADLNTRFLGFMARRFGTVFTLALMQTAEQRSPYAEDADATAQMKADEAIHAEVIRGLAARGREQMSGNFRAAIFGANDGLVSNLALVLGVMASGVSGNVVLITGVSGLLSGALSMGAGEYISVKSQNELLDASTPDPQAQQAVPQLDVDFNELALVYRARGMDAEAAQEKAEQVLAAQEEAAEALVNAPVESPGGAMSAAISSFCCFGLGALVPIFPFFFGLSASVAGTIAVALVGMVLLLTGGLTGVISGKPPLRRALRQLAIGMAAAAVTYVLGRLFGVAIG
ncbi:MAG: VIT1/CCC1 transporter family protein [Corynebacterium sp.]|nr:VIT1/CCC1 transporter family protein [Corynebacterium sp.]